MPENKSSQEKFVVFRIGEQEFCIEISLTREIRGWTQSTSLPHSPDYLVGVINLRGVILPIVNLAVRLGLPSDAPSERHVIIVVQFNNKAFGLLVDSVSDILNVTPEELRSVPELDSKLEEDFFKRVVVQNNQIICEIALDQIIPELEVFAA